MKSALLVLEDGTFFPGRAFGRDGEAIGEVAFNTAVFGFQEIVTDPASAGRLVAFAANTVGAAGTNALDMESEKAQARGVIVRTLSRVASNFRSTQPFDAFCEEQGVVGIADVDTRALTIHLRETGAQMGAIVAGASAADVEAIVARIRAATPYDQERLAATVGVQEVQGVGLQETEDSFQPLRVIRSSELDVADGNEVVVVDLGASTSLLRQIADAGFQVTLVPASTSSADILARKPTSVLVSPGPGSPAVLSDVVETVRGLLSRVTVVGVGLGCQVVALAVGGEAYRIPSPNLGTNIPVRRTRDSICGVVEHRHTWGIRFPNPVEALEVSYTNVTTGAAEGFDLAPQSAYGIQHIPTDAKLLEVLSSALA